MIQYSKLLKSRDDWKEKASKRADEIRERKKGQKHYQQRIKELKATIRQLRVSTKKNNAS